MTESDDWAALLAIEAWLDEHGWDAIRSQEFKDWREREGYGDDKITCFVCGTGERSLDEEHGFRERRKQ